MTYRIEGLDPSLFAPLWGQDAAALAASRACRYRVDAVPGFPCRITLDDAPMGARVLLVSHSHLDTASPYAQSGPVFVTEGETRRAVYRNEVPPALVRRLLSVRAFDARGMMVDAEVLDGGQLDSWIRTAFADPATAFLQAHNARRGCFAATIARAD
jgi:hypothetical protein